MHKKLIITILNNYNPLLLYSQKYFKKSNYFIEYWRLSIDTPLHFSARFYLTLLNLIFK